VSNIPSWIPFELVFDRLRGRLVGLTDDEYLWEPAPRPVPTIAARLGHIGGLLREERNWRWMGREPGPADAEIEQPTTAAAGVASLEAGYAAWDELVGSLSEADLWRPLGEVAGPFAEEPVVALILHILDELIHHGAEVALLRDLYAAIG
jgi:DinB superfamily